MASERYYPLIEEIKNHVFQWATEKDWKTLPKALNVALTQVMNELKIYDTLKDIGAKDDREGEETGKQAKWGFIRIFKRKYLEATDMNFDEPITPINQVNINRTITDISREGGNYVDFVEWFFDDFCSLESNKKFYMPPTINKMCCSVVVKKYLYEKKDELRIHKEEISNQAVRNLLLQVALPFAERTKNREFSQKILDFSNGILSVTKFFELMKNFAEKLDDREAIAGCAKLDLDKSRKRKK